MDAIIRGGVGPMLEPRISVTLLDITDYPLVLDVTIDTGFTGFLALPSSIITQLCLPSMSKVPIELADGSTVNRMYYDATSCGEESFVPCEPSNWRPVRSSAPNLCGAIGSVLIWSLAEMLR